ncbi:MAG: hypothetical protein H7338_09430 [Candidatus Sericytochromatia bacterium]|nr:hypothetical protein [Candidatus Sericytochromatia bacterium]
MSTTLATSPRPKFRRAIWITVAGILSVVLIIVGAAWISFRAKAEGIAVGYMQAASSAYQMGRPIPDAIFETGVYRVQVVSQVAADKGPGNITVYVKDRFLNQTFFEESRAVGMTIPR